MSIRSYVTQIRLVSRAGHAEHRVITPDEIQPGDVIEILDRPVYQVDPLTRECRETLQQFDVHDHGVLTVKQS